MDGLVVKPRREVPLERGFVRRSRLLEAMEASERRTVLLVAPAGYGKTTLARQWLGRVEGAWVGLGPGSADVPVLAREIGRALAELAGLDSSRVETALGAAKAPSDQAKAVAHTILTSAPASVEGWLVIDDYHLLSSNPAAEELVGLLERSGRLNLLVASRERPVWATSRRRVHLETLELGQAELALDDEEISALLPPGKRTAALRRQARGWPAVIGLAARGDASSAPPSADTLSEALYDYFADELYERTPLDVRRFLRSLAVLPPLDIDQLADILGAPDAGERAVATGLAFEVDRRVIVHPLARDFLRAKLGAEDDVSDVVDMAYDLMLAKSLYDDAFALIRDFALADRLEPLIASSHAALIESGRIATLQAFGTYAEAHGDVSQRLLDLIAAEIALRDGAFERAYSLGRSAGDALPDGHALKARCYVIAGSAAHLMYRFDEALELHSNAAEHAVAVGDANDAAWGKCLALRFLEDASIVEAVSDLESIASPRPTDRVRVALARANLAFLGMNGSLRSALPDASHLLAVITDPWVRSGWSVVRSYSLVLQGRYGEAQPLARATRSELDEFGLSFGLPHADWVLAASELGLRHFARCDALLRRVEGHMRYVSDLHFQLNVRALRARLYLAQQRAEEALALTEDDFEPCPNRAMYGEYLSTRALALAVLGEECQALAAITQATTITRVVEAQILSKATRLVVARHDPVAARSAASDLLDAASGLAVWDPLVCSVRAAPDVLPMLAEFSPFRAELRDVLVNSNDIVLAKRAGLATRSSGPRGVLSSREREVLDQVAQGRTNVEVAAALFISPGTVKRHMDHIFDKLGVRTRAAAVARYAEIETTAGIDSASGS